MTKVVGIVGGGIQGCLAALVLAGKGCRVVIYERADDILTRASRQNEGKVHIGFTYGLDYTGQTQRLLYAHGSKFFEHLAQIVGQNVDDLALHHRAYYAVPKSSLLSGAAIDAHFALVEDLHTADAVAGYKSRNDAPVVKRMGVDFLRHHFSDEVERVYEVAESSIDVHELCDLIHARVADEPRIEIVPNSSVVALGAAPSPTITVDKMKPVRFDIVINAAWDGLAKLEAEKSEEFEGLCLRAKCGFIAEAHSDIGVLPVTFSWGSYGDVVPMRDNKAYLSWYPACLMGFNPDGRSGPDWYDGLAQEFDFADAYAQSVSAFQKLMPAIEFSPEPLEMRGGAILAAARSDISDPKSGLHRRSQFGLVGEGGRLAINTAKLTCAPGLAVELGKRFN